MSLGSQDGAPDDVFYTRQHEWVREAAGSVTVGITAYAADALGDVVFLDLPTTGTRIVAGEPCGEIESTKSVSELYSPVTGEVVEINEDAIANPAIVNSSPYGRGWLLRVVYEPPLPALLSSTEYTTLCDGDR